MFMNLRSEKLYIEETDHLEKRMERSEEAHQRALDQQAEISERLVKLEAEKESNAMASLIEIRKLYGLLVLLAIVLFVADWPIQYALNSVAFTTLSGLGLIVLSVLVAAGLGVCVKVAAFAMYFDPYRPRRTVRKCLTAAAISGALAALAGTLLLYSRTATGEVVGFLAQVVPTCMWVLGETLPIAAGFLSAAAWTLGYPKRRDDQIDRLKNRVSELSRFLEWLDRDGKKKVVSHAVTMLVLGVLLAAPGFSQEGNRCLIYVDMTHSVQPEFRNQTVSRIRETLPNFIEAFHCTILGIGTFADEGPFSPMTEVEIAQRPQAEECAKTTPNVEGLQKITQKVSGFQEYYRKRAETECNGRMEIQLSVFRQRLQASVNRIDAALNSDLPPRGQCTAINSLLSSAVERGSTVLVATDGSETCDRGPRAFRLPARKRLIFVLLPSRGSVPNRGRAALRLANQWKEHVPGLQVVLPSEVNPQFWGALAAHSR
jgi:hypothetical protein